MKQQSPAARRRGNQGRIIRPGAHLKAMRVTFNHAFEPETKNE